MNTTLSTRPGRQDHPPQPVHPGEQRPLRRVNLLDRLALHLGVALIKWGRRPRAAATREQLMRLHNHRMARLQRERDAERMLRHLLPLQ